MKKTAKQPRLNNPKKSELAFEEDFRGSLEWLWRVVSIRKHGKRSMRHTNWFSQERDADAYVQRVHSEGDEIVMVAKYARAYIRTFSYCATTDQKEPTQ